MPTEILKEQSSRQPEPKRITVFTPAYNRADIIEKLYHSLQRQHFTDFEWLVVDDGSTDRTEAVFGQWLSENNPFPIRYIRQENGGKHRAVNQGIAKAMGELFMIVDSDDYLADDALTLVDAVEKTIPASERSNFAGVCGLKAFFDKTPIGSSFEGDFLDITNLEREKHHVFGDKGEVFYTELLKKYPFPEFPNEKFITECVVWDRIGGDGFKLRFFNDPLIFCEYRKDGLSSNIQNAFISSPRGYALYIIQNRKYQRFNEKQFSESCFDYYCELRHTLSSRTIAEYLGIPYRKLLKIIVKFHVLRSLYHLYMCLPEPVRNLYRNLREKTGVGLRPVK